MSIRIVIADASAIYRDGFKVLLAHQTEVKIVGEAQNGQELLELVATLKPQVVVTDIDMPLMDGIAATRQLKAHYPDIEVIAFCGFEQPEGLAHMMVAGAKGFLLKSTHREQLLQAIRLVHNKGTYYGPDISVQQLLMQLRQPPKQTPTVRLSDKDLLVMRLICQQYTTKEIAEKLGMSVRTLEDQRMYIARKIGAKNIAGIISYAVKHGIYQI